jgi:hypothetical protein
VKAGGRQRTDSTRALAAVRDLNRLELAGETLRAALDGPACAVPDWLAGAVPVREWAERYGPRIHSWHPPTSTSKREEMALVYGRDGFALLEAVRAPDAPAWLRELPAVQALPMIWVQNYHLRLLLRRVDRGHEEAAPRSQVVGSLDHVRAAPGRNVDQPKDREQAPGRDRRKSRRIHPRRPGHMVSGQVIDERLGAASDVRRRN